MSMLSMSKIDLHVHATWHIYSKESLMRYASVQAHNLQRGLIAGWLQITKTITVPCTAQHLLRMNGDMSLSLAPQTGDVSFV
jgi:hypothetical protein